MIESERLLVEAANLWSVTWRGQREAKLKIGELLSLYVIARAKEAANHYQKNRLARGLNREAVIKEAGIRLGIHGKKINKMIGTFWAVKLLSNAGDIGELPYCSLEHMRVLVRRPVGNVCRNKKLSPGDLSAEAKEIWRIVPPEDDSIAVFREAVAGNWTGSDILIAIECMGEPATSCGEKQCREDRTVLPSMLTPLETIKLCAERGSPQDIVDMIVQLIQSSSNPDFVIKMLHNRILELRNTA